MNERAVSAEHIDFPCQSCGAKLEYKPGTLHLECTHCGSRQALDRDNSKAIVEYSFEEARSKAREAPDQALVPNGHVVACQGCGAETVLTGIASRCAFCDAPVVLVEQKTARFLPESLLPFRIDEKTAHESFKTWIVSRWFAPGDLVRRATRDAMNGVYLPYWTYDSKTTTHYVGMRGDHYYVTESYRDSQGRTQTRRVQKTRWSPASGVVRVGFDDVLVPATKSLPGTLLNDLEPWDLAALEAYSPSYLSGFLAERYGVGLEEGFEIAQTRMDPTIRAAIRRDIGGDTQTIASMRVMHADVRFKHLLLPLWISAFRYGEKVYRFVVNARTGEASGQRPYSIIKIALATTVALALIGVLVYLYSVMNNQ